MYLLAFGNIGTCISCSSHGRRKSYDNFKEWSLSLNAAITTTNYLQDLWKLHDKHSHWLHISCISSSKKKKKRENYRVGMGVAVKNYPLTRWLSFVLFKEVLFLPFLPFSLFKCRQLCLSHSELFISGLLFSSFLPFIFFLFLFILENFIPAEQLFIAHVGGSGSGTGNGRPLTTAIPDLVQVSTCGIFV